MNQQHNTNSQNCGQINLISIQMKQSADRKQNILNHSN